MSCLWPQLSFPAACTTPLPRLPAAHQSTLRAPAFLVEIVLSQMHRSQAPNATQQPPGSRDQALCCWDRELSSPLTSFFLCLKRSCDLVSIMVSMMLPCLSLTTPRCRNVSINSLSEYCTNHASLVCSQHQLCCLNLFSHQFGRG